MGVVGGGGPRALSMNADINGAGDAEKQRLLADGDRNAPGGRTGIRGSVFNTVNSTIGAGAVAMPWAIMSSGIVLSSVLLVGVAVIATYCAWMMFVCAGREKSLLFDETGYAAFGRWGRVAVQIAEIVLCIGLLASYIDILFDQLVLLLQLISHEVVSTYGLLVLGGVVLFVLFPLALLRRIHHLRHFSLFSLLCFVFLACLMVIRGAGQYWDKAVRPCSVVAVSPDFWSIFRTIPIFGVAFVVHFNICHLYRELKNRSVTRMRRVTINAMIISTAVYAVVGIFGYLQFCGATEGDIMKNYPSTDVTMSVARVAMVISFSFVYPMIHFACRNACHSILFGENPSTMAHHAMETLCIVGMTFLIAVKVPHVQDIFALTGAISATFVVYILPAAHFLKLRPDGYGSSAEGVASGLQNTELRVAGHRWAARMVLVFGAVVGVIGTYLAVVRLVEGL